MQKFDTGRNWQSQFRPSAHSHRPKFKKNLIGVLFKVIHIVIPLRAKQVGEFIENRHKKISPTCIGSGSGVTLWLFDSVTLWLCVQQTV